MPPRTIVANPTSPSNTLSFSLPPGVSIDVESVLAAIDATAAGDTTALLEIADSSGAVIARKRQGEAITAGTNPGSATWALRLADEQAAPAASSAIEYAILFGQHPGLATGPSYQPFNMAITTTNAPARYNVQDLGNGATALTILKEGVYKITFGFRFFLNPSSAIFNSRVAASNYLTFNIVDLAPIIQNFWALGFFAFYPFNTGDGTWNTANLSMFGVSAANAGAAQVITEAEHVVTAAMTNVECNMLVELIDPVYP